ncbi:hypothetical protein AVEN_12584-1 [Araneus ventricosus]|uniref:Uncharacterized protein n=1 Tax=Araneus ventricosus TaxID=182803 RepID=A0A4Y2ACF1_ARAVE|nr:hypothetical protein AVEN_12584-1 [Araneus ventricosus]
MVLADFLPQFYQGRVCKYAFGRGRAVAGNGCLDSGISTRAIAAAVTQIHRTENAPDRGDFDIDFRLEKSKKLLQKYNIGRQIKQHCSAVCGTGAIR